MQRCIALALAKRFDFDRLCDDLSRQARAVRFRDALHLHQGDAHAFVFTFGCCVLWGYDHEDEAHLLAQLAEFAEEPLAERQSDTFSWETGPWETRIHADLIRLADDSALLKLAVSHALAQSAKLAELERYAERTIAETAYIPRNMAKGGSSGMSRKEVARMRGRLFLVESDIHLHHGLLDTPEFFWEYPELESPYLQAIHYMDVRPRIEVLNKKLQVIHEMFDMLADEQKHQHSSQLEWIIIWLIAIEIVIFFVHDLLGLI